MNFRAVLLTAAFWPLTLHAQNVPGIYIPSVPGAPFTAEQTMSWTHQVNGQLKTGTLVSTVARDSQGRIHTEGHSFNVVNTSTQDSLGHLTFQDPIAGTSVVCDMNIRVCHIYNFKAPTPEQIADPHSLESLAEKGLPSPMLLAKGTRQMRTEPLGSTPWMALSLPECAESPHPSGRMDNQ